MTFRIDKIEDLEAHVGSVQNLRSDFANLMSAEIDTLRVRAITPAYGELNIDFSRGDKEKVNLCQAGISDADFLRILRKHVNIWIPKKDEDYQRAIAHAIVE